MNGPIPYITCVSNIFIKQMYFERAGDKEEGHAHLFDHVTLLASGKLKLTALGTSSEFTAPHHIFIKAGVIHELEALEDGTTVHCIHGIRGEKCEDIVDPASLPGYARHLDSRIYPLALPKVELP